MFKPKSFLTCCKRLHLHYKATSAIFYLNCLSVIFIEVEHSWFFIFLFRKKTRGTLEENLKIYLIFNNFFYLDEIFFIHKKSSAKFRLKVFCKTGFSWFHSFAYATERMPVWRQACATTIQRRLKKSPTVYCNHWAKFLK